MKSFKMILLCASAVSLLTACGSTSNSNQGLQSHHTNKFDAALQNAAAKTSHAEALPFLGTIYKRNSNDPAAALGYAQALRQAGEFDQAGLVLAPFAFDKNSPSSVKTEYAAIQLAIGNYTSAEGFAQKAVAQNEDDYEAFHYLGIAQDARGLHTDAETSFRKALKNWEGSPVPVLNNLALNLATQKRPNEAVEFIDHATALAPNRRDIQQNRRIINALQQVYVAPTPPAPAKKPA